MKRYYFRRRGTTLHCRFFWLCLALYFAAMPCHAAQADATTEAQLRAALQQETGQIAQLEDQVANLQAQQAPDVAMINALQAQIQTLKVGGPGAQTPAQKAAQDKAVAALKRQLAAQGQNLAKLKMRILRRQLPPTQTPPGMRN